jgi:hypothetical protein
MHTNGSGSNWRLIGAVGVPETLLMLQIAVAMNVDFMLLKMG